MRTEDLTIVQNTDAKIKLFITDSSGESLDLNGKNFSASMKKNFYDTTSIDFTTEIVSANGGILSLSLTSTQTGELDYNSRYFYDVKMFESGNTSIEQILEGKVFVKPSVTQVG